MSMEELKACPFCGGDNIVVKPEDSFYYVESEFPFAKCLDCGVMIKAEKYYNTGRKGFDVTWNTRSYESDIESLQAENAKLKAKLEVAQKKREEKYTRWCCPQCFTSVRSTINLYKEKPEYKCPDHPNLDYVVIDKSLSALREKGV